MSEQNLTDTHLCRVVYTMTVSSILMETIAKELEEVGKLESEVQNVSTEVDTNTINGFIHLIESVDSSTYRVAMQMVKVLHQRDPSRRIALRMDTGTKMIRLIGEYCYDVCMNKLDCTEALDEANHHIRDLFGLFLLPKACWVKNNEYLLSAMVIAAQKPDPYIKSAFSALIKDKQYEKAYTTTCQRIVKASKEIKYTKVFNLKKYASEYLEASELVKAEKEMRASAAAMALVAEEDALKKAKKNKNKKANATAKVPWVDEGEDVVYEEEECVVCMEEMPDVVYACGHKICCTACSAKVRHLCPICKK